MDEKKLTDEEIIEALKKQPAHDTVLYLEKGINATDILNLIHRLQADNIQLKWNYVDLKERYVKVLDLNEKVIADKSAEIERLTSELEIAKGTKDRLTIFDRIKIHDKAVEKTAKEILILAEDYNCGYETDIDNFVLALKGKYGVEVE